ncbi:MAG TPA: hypothetical protein PLZ29_07550 [Spirochaetota bacterium]|nr:hypothetical protein [Spirochaetota bacterium]
MGVRYVAAKTFTLLLVHDVGIRLAYRARMQHLHLFIGLVAMLIGCCYCLAIVIDINSITATISGSI